MENKKLAKQMIDFHKTSLQNSFSTMEMFRNQAEKFLQIIIDHTPGISAEGKQVLEQWSNTYKKTVNELQKTMNNGYDKLEVFLENNTVFAQDSYDKMINPFLNQQNWLNVDLKESVEEVTDPYKSGAHKIQKQTDKKIKPVKNLSPVKRLTVKTKKKK
ncbi:MAG: hypothetical protein QUS13_11040 [Smithella sp.]|nr:hypothetical protein [Smithella sp.]